MTLIEYVCPACGGHEYLTTLVVNPQHRHRVGEEILQTGLILLKRTGQTKEIKSEDPNANGS